MSSVRFHPYGYDSGGTHRAPVYAPGVLAAAGVRAASLQSPAKVDPRFDINGITFKLRADGTKLKRLTPSDGDAPPTPPTHEIAGVKFYRTKGGNLLRHKEYLELQEKHGQRPRKRDEPCVRFTTTGISWLPKPHRPDTVCTSGGANVWPGICDRNCPFQHDFNKVAVCKHFLYRGQCRNGSRCPLSHDLTPHRVPHCLHHARGKCASGTTCHFAHIKPKEGARVCYAFGKLGYCAAGADCPDAHIFQCPDYANTGACENKHCRLAHVQTAAHLRRQAGVLTPESSEEDVSAVTSGDEQTAVDFSQQADFVRLAD